MSSKTPSNLPLYHPARLIEARVPIGFAMHMGANYLLKHFPLTLQIPLVLLVWWELAKEFPLYRKRVGVSMTVLQLAELYVISQYPSLFTLIGMSPLQLFSVQFVVLFGVLHLLGVRPIDNVILNYLLFGVTIGNLLICNYEPQVMLTISMAIAGSDCIQYFVGKKFGKTKIVPKISPNKSLEGYIGAIVGCNIIHYFLVLNPISARDVIYVNVMLFVGIIGDLFISWWKRQHKLKDTSNLLTAHGGFLDRLDSHLAAWIWSYLFAMAVGSTSINFTNMKYENIEVLIAIAWTCVWLRFFYVAITKGELV